ncbi:asparaginase [Cohnella ginsengisoli]|uniref:asparaginase n=1 Tax=Cohnella ginsengisoli TaxID=425004 RepID=A0A9X4KLP7_9BACL|nr:asparaginase [Cohnella ginsengisoli]MDG0794348.1 asparaginase [Cohnella ginsengisoli]
MSAKLPAKILVLFTGGTIGSRRGAHGIDVDASGSYFLMEQYAQIAGAREIAFETSQPCNLLSENLVPGDWATLTEAVRAAYGGGYAGVIVTHGSDTLSFTSAMLSYLCCDAPFPVVLTAANYPLDDPRSNGLANFAASVDFIADAGLPGVFALFGNDRGDSVVYVGTRITQALPFTDQFDAPYAAPFGRMRNGRFEPDPHPLNPAPAKLARSAPPSPPATPTRDDAWPAVLYVKPYPGLDYRVYDFDARRPRAVLHDTYHSGTANARDGAAGRSLVSFISYCRERGVDVYLVPMRSPEGDMYASSSHLTGAGGIALGNISSEAALMKLLLACAVFADDREVERFVRTPLFFEYMA